MLLFQDEKEKKSKLARKTFYVVSTRPDANTSICQQIRLVGIESVVLIEKNILNDSDIEIPEDAKGVIIDIENSTSYEQILMNIRLQVHRAIWCCLVGNNDSIEFSQKFTAHCQGYYHLYYQKDDLIHAVLTCGEKKVMRKAVTVSVLGCKGGVGCTAIGYHLARDIEKIKRMSTIYVQGRYCSADLDLLSGKDVPVNMIVEHKGLSLLSTDDISFPDTTDAIYSKYNFVVFEQSVINIEKETIQEIIGASLCIVIIIDRSISSLRVANKIIEQITLLAKTTNASRRFFICLNDSRPRQRRDLSTEEIEKIIDDKIDIHFPFNSENRKMLFKTVLPRERLSSMVLGVQNLEQRKWGINSFKGLLKK